MGFLIEGRNLNKRFENRGRQTDALRDVSFTLMEGEFLGIVGESGSGKSTLLNAISGLISVDSGQILYRDRDITDTGAGERGRFLQMIFQNAQGSFDPRMRMKRSILENGRGRADIPGIIELAGTVGLDAELLDRYPAALSGGQCQRMSIVRALYSGAGILLCDEITSALDVSSQAQILSILEDLRNKKSLSAIFVSHDIALVSMLCGRIMVMKDGEVVEAGETVRIISDPKEEYTRTLIESARRQSI